jgi:hypothetical protein
MTDTMTTKTAERLASHIEWLRDNHEHCNPFIANDIEALAARVAELERTTKEAVAAAVQTVLDDVGYTYEQLGEDARALIAEYGGKSDV